MNSTFLTDNIDQVYRRSSISWIVSPTGHQYLPAISISAVAVLRIQFKDYSIVLQKVVELSILKIANQEGSG